jgi:hypothetical protein
MVSQRNNKRDMLPTQKSQKGGQNSRRKNSRLNLSSLTLSTMDTYIPSSSVSTTQSSIQLEDGAMGPSGQFATYPQVFKPYMAGTTTGVRDFVGIIHFKHLELRMNIVGAQTNAILPADTFNRVRVLLFWTKTPYRGTVTSNAITIDTLVDRRDIDVVLYDKVHNLSSTAFDSASGYNVPATRSFELSIPLSDRQEVFSNGGGVTWDSRSGSYRLALVSDSTAAPHPTYSMQSRLYYTINR